MAERRDTARLPMEAPARLLSGWQHVIRCTVRNLSAAGACIELDATVPLKNEIDLFISHPRFESACRVVWRSTDRVGVRFIDGS